MREREGVLLRVEATSPSCRFLLLWDGRASLEPAEVIIAVSAPPRCASSHTKINRGPRWVTLDCAHPEPRTLLVLPWPPCQIIARAGPRQCEFVTFRLCALCVQNESCLATLALCRAVPLEGSRDHRLFALLASRHTCAAGPTDPLCPQSSSPASPPLSDSSASVLLVGGPCDDTGPCWVVQKNPQLESLGSITAKLDDIVTGRGLGCGLWGAVILPSAGPALSVQSVSQRDIFISITVECDIKVLFLFFHADFLFGS